MYLSKVIIQNCRNFKNTVVEFNEGIDFIIGPYRRYSKPYFLYEGQQNMTIFYECNIAKEIVFFHNILNLG